MEVRKLIGTFLSSEIEPPELGEAQELKLGQDRLLLWGLPQRGEDDAEKALSSALSTLPRDVRAHIGEFRVQVDGERVLGTEGSFSPQALLSKLEPGDISVDADLAKIYDRLFLFEQIEEEHLFLLRGRRRRPARIRGLKSKHAKLIGREAEKEEFRELLEQITEDQGQILGIVGEAGIGKTRLVEDLIEETQKAGIPFLHASYPIGTQEPYLAFRKIVRDLAQGDARTLSRWNVRELEIEFLRLLLEPDQKIEALSNLSESEIQGGLFRATRKLFYTSSQTPRVIFIDDLHWSTSDDLNMINHVLEDLEKTRLLLVLIHRPIQDRKWTQRLNYNELKLEAFTNEEVEAFLKENLQVDRIPRQDLEELLHLSLGSPLFLEEIVRKLRDENLIETERLPDGKKLLRLQDTLKASRLPRTIAGILDSGFDKLPGQTRKALQWLSIFGSNFDVDEVDSFFQAEGLDPLQITKIQGLGYTYERSVFPNRIHAFSHDLVFETISETIPKTVQKEMNQNLASFLERNFQETRFGSIERVANLFDSSNSHTKAFEWNLKAGKLLFGRMKYTQALSHLQKAREHSRKLSVEEKDLNELYFLLTSTFASLAKIEECREALARWKETDQSDSLRALLCESQLEIMVGNEEYACSITEETFKNRNQFSQESEVLYEVLVQRVIALLFSGKPEQCRAEGETLLKEMDPNLYPEIRFQLLGRLSYTVYAAGDYEEGLRYLERAEKCLNRPPTLKERMWLHNYYGNFLRQGLNLEESLRHYSEVIHTSEELGMTIHQINGLVQRASVSIDGGFYKKCYEDLERLREFKEISENKKLDAMFRLQEVDFLFELGAIEEAEKSLQTLEKDYLDVIDHWDRAQLFALQGYRQFCKDQFGGAIDKLSEAVKLSETLGNKMSATRIAAHALTLTAMDPKSDPTDSLSRLREIQAAANHISVPRTHLILWVAEIAVASRNPSLSPDLERYSLAKIFPYWIRRLAYLATLFFFHHRKRRGEYDQLMLEMKKAQEDHLQHIPKTFHQAFLNHPIYSPQAIERLIQKGQN